MFLGIRDPAKDLIAEDAPRPVPILCHAVALRLSPTAHQVRLIFPYIVNKIHNNWQLGRFIGRLWQLTTVASRLLFFLLLLGWGEQ